jgi:hypothetical protein
LENLKSSRLQILICGLFYWQVSPFADAQGEHFGKCSVQARFKPVGKEDFEVGCINIAIGIDVTCEIWACGGYRKFLKIFPKSP